MPKKKTKAKSQKAKSNPPKTTPKTTVEDDDWDAILEANTATTTSESATPTETPKEDETPTPTPDNDTPDAAQDAAAAFLAAQGLDAAPTETTATKSKRKKKKGKKTSDKSDEKVSAKGALIAERLRLQREEEEKLRLAQEAEAARIAELERQEEEERRRKEEEKERKKQAKKDKIARQKAEGTYMTPAQKKKAALAAQRLEAMKAAGMVPDVEKKGRVVYGNKKKGKKGKGGGAKKDDVEEEVEKKDDVEEEVEEKDDVEEEVEEKDDVEEVEKETLVEAAKATESVEATEATENKKDDDASESDAAWDASSQSSTSDWESTTPQFASLTQKLDKIHLSDDEEDLIALEQKKERERLRKLGIEREKREMEERARRQKEEAQMEEMSRKEQLAAMKREEGRRKRESEEAENLAKRSREDLRCPIVVIMGHVDTGKTKLLDKIRKTNVQEGEAGGITQQIGATFFEKKTLEQQTKRLNEVEKFDLTIPGMLVIDTPGHESFTNLRSRGSSLCDVAILVVDLMHGLEQQTIESLNMLVKKGTPFVVALNKIDRCYDWKTCPDAPIREALKEQPEGTVQEFRNRALDAKVQLQEQGINSNIYWEMGEDDWENSDFVPLVPTSAITGEGVQDVLLLLCQMAQRKIWRQLMWCANLQCTVLEVKAIDGLGMTVDVLIVNGFLREGDKAVFCTLDGPIVTEIRGLLTPPPSREMRIKSEYIHHKQVKGALGVKLIGNNLDKVMAGTPVMVVGPNDEEEDIKAEVMSDLTTLTSKLSTDKKGVMVQASTLGALEALLQFLREETKPPIPVSAIGIGTVHKRDVTKISIMNEKGKPEFATILAFDVEIEREARDHAQEMSVRIFTADIIYHLFDQFTRFMEDLKESRRQEAAAVAVFPSICKILPQHIFNTKDPIIIGVEVVDGILKVGTPLCVPALGGLYVGKVTSIETNGKVEETARKGASVAVKIVNETNPTITYGRQFDARHSLYSMLSRASIDALKENFKEKLETEDWRLVVKLKKIYNII